MINMSRSELEAVRPTSAILAEQLQGALTRVFASAAVLSVTLGGFLVVGAEFYGESLSLLAVPYIVQGILEPIIMAIQIRWLLLPDGAGRIAQLRRHLIGAGSVGILVSCAALVAMPTAATLSVLRLACTAGFLSLSILNAYLIGAVFALALHSHLWKSYSVYLLTFWVSLFLLKDQGTDGFLLSLCLSQLALLATLYASRTLRHYAASSGPVTAGTSKTLFKEYLLALSPRLAIIVLGPVMLAFGAISMNAVNLAAYKLATTIANVIKLAIPISPETIQVSFNACSERSYKRSRRFASRLFVALLLGAICLSCIAYVCRHSLYLRLLGIMQPDSLRITFLGMPFFFLIQPLGSYLLALRRSRALVFSTGATILGASVVGGLFGVPAGFAAGSVGYVVAAVASQSLAEKEGLFDRHKTSLAHAPSCECHPHFAISTEGSRPDRTSLFRHGDKNERVL